MKISKSISFDERFMREVYLVASQSKDPRTKIGAVIIEDNDIISTGYNGFPRGILDLEERYNNREIKTQFVKHAESNAILNAARKGSSTRNSILFTQGIPCNECMKDIIQAGIKKIVCHKQWPNLFSSEKWVQSINISKILMLEADIELVWLYKVLNIDGFLDNNVIKI